LAEKREEEESGWAAWKGESSTMRRPQGPGGEKRERQPQEERRKVLFLATAT